MKISKSKKKKKKKKKKKEKEKEKEKERGKEKEEEDETKKRKASEAGLQKIAGFPSKKSKKEKKEGEEEKEKEGEGEEEEKDVPRWLFSRRKIAWEPLLDDGKEGKPTDTRYGGRPWLLAGEQHPLCGNCNNLLSLLCQLNLSFIPPYTDITGGGGNGGLSQQEGLIQLLICPFGCDNGSLFPQNQTHLIRHIELSNKKGTLSSSGSPFPPKLVAGWKPRSDLPNVHSFSKPTTAQKSHLSSQETSSLLSKHDKLYGYPFWAKYPIYPSCPECYEKMDVFFQLSGEDHQLEGVTGSSSISHIYHCSEHSKFAFSWE